MTGLWRLLLRHNQRFPQRALQLLNSCVVVLRSLRCLSLRNVNVLSLNLDFLANESDLVGQCPSFQFERRINRGLDLVRDLGHDVLELNLWSQYFPFIPQYIGCAYCDSIDKLYNLAAGDRRGLGPSPCGGSSVGMVVRQFSLPWRLWLWP
jgi:hypothetical protein